jgi:hypothetical protein
MQCSTVGPRAPLGKILTIARRAEFQQVGVFRGLPLARQLLCFQLISALVEHHEKALLRQHFTDIAVDRVGSHPA